MIAPIEFVMFGSLTIGFLLAGLAVRRVAVSTPSGPVALRKRSDRSLAKSDCAAGRLDDWIETTTLRSGVPADAVTLLVAAAGLAILSGVAANVGGLEMPFPIAIALVVFGCFWIAVHGLAVRRQKQFVAHFPTAIDMMARSVQAGESFEEALNSASRTVSEPVASELNRLAQELELGMQVSSSMDSFARRNSLTDVKIFANTVSLHRETGGRLADTLARLAEVIRQRSDYMRKVRSATSLGRFAAIAIVLGGLFVLGYMLMVHPDYIQKLWESELGLKLVYYAVASEVVGLIWVAITLKQEY